MNSIINQVGRRWYVVYVYDEKGRRVGTIEASYVIHTVWDETPLGWKGHAARKWTLTGKGSNKYRDYVVERLEEMKNVEC